MRYLTDQQGERIGVLLDLESYRHLVDRAERNSERLEDLSREELQALALARLAPDAQALLDILLTGNVEGTLSPKETIQLDSLLAQADHLTLLVARARLALRKLDGAPEGQ